jgi:hypothetical protein
MALLGRDRTIRGRLSWSLTVGCPCTPSLCFAATALGGDHQILEHDASEGLGGAPLVVRAPARMTPTPFASASTLSKACPSTRNTCSAFCR